MEQVELEQAFVSIYALTAIASGARRTVGARAPVRTRTCASVYSTIQLAMAEFDDEPRIHCNSIALQPRHLDADWHCQLDISGGPQIRGWPCRHTPWHGGGIRRL